jgi:lysophospholipase L1-like esterase
LKTFLGRVALALLSVVVALGLCEIAVRMSPLAPSRENLRNLHELRTDKPWLFGMKPGASVIGPGGARYTVNADGFRDRVYARPKPPGTYRVMILGHSVGFGWAVDMEQTYPKLLEDDVQGLGGAPRIEVMNASVCAYNAYNEAALFADVGPAFEPDLVIVEFGINDLNDPTLHFDGNTTLALGELPDEVFPDPTRRLPPRPEPSLAWRLCRLSELCVLAHQRFFPAPPDGEWLRVSAMPREEHSDREIDWLVRQYDKIAREAERIGARFAILLLPYSNQVAGSASPRVQERVAAAARAKGWTTVDLLPAFRAASRPGERFFLDLWHFTPGGHRVAAHATLEQLCCQGLLPVARDRCCGEPPGEVSRHARTLVGHCGSAPC